MNVPPELARDVGHVLERRTDDNKNIIGRRRHSSGMKRAGRALINNAFRKSVACWHIQSDDAKKDWYAESRQSGMRYYNYFMHKTIPEYYRGQTPNWCEVLSGYMMEVAGYNWFEQYLMGGEPFDNGDRIRLELTCTWSNHGRYDDPWEPGYYYFDEIYFAFQLTKGWEDNFLLQLMLRGEDGCGGFEESEWEEDDLKIWEYTLLGHFEDHVIKTFSYEKVLPNNFDLSSGASGTIYINVENTIGWDSFNRKSVAWILGYRLLVNDEVVYKKEFGEPQFDPRNPEMGGAGVIPQTNDPYSRYDLPIPICES